MSFDYVEPNTETWTRGWGHTNDFGDVLSVLKEVKIKTRDNADATERWGRDVDSTMIAAGGVYGEDSCIGDSGGPLTIESHTDSAVKLVGIVSWGAVPCGQANMPGIYSRLSAFKLFLENHCKRTHHRPVNFTENQFSIFNIEKFYSQCA